MDYTELGSKKGFVQHKGPTVKKWKRCWLIVADGILQLFEENMMDPIKETAMGLVGVKVTAVPKGKDKDPNFVFQLEKPAHKKFKELVFGVDTEDEYKEWVQVFNESISLANPNIFGVDLAITMKKLPAGKRIPSIIDKSLKFLEGAMKVEGIFRVSAAQTDVVKYKESWDNGEDVEFPSYLDPHVASNLLKLYLRELPNPLLTWERYSKFVEAARSGDFVNRSRELIRDLPYGNKQTLHTLLTFLRKVAEQSAVNKMTTMNLATVFGPTILRAKEENIMNAHSHEIANNICEMLIQQVDQVFDGVDMSAPAQGRSSLTGSRKSLQLQQSSESLLGSTPPPALPGPAPAFNAPPVALSTPPPMFSSIPAVAEAVKPTLRSVNSLTTIVSAPVDDWAEFSTPDGRKYYYNRTTRETAWIKPGQMPPPPPPLDVTDWVEYSTSDGKKYYYNSVTQETSWTRPGDDEETNGGGILSESSSEISFEPIPFESSVPDSLPAADSLPEISERSSPSPPTTPLPVAHAIPPSSSSAPASPKISSDSPDNALGRKGSLKTMPTTSSPASTSPVSSAPSSPATSKPDKPSRPVTIAKKAPPPDSGAMSDELAAKLARRTQVLPAPPAEVLAAAKPPTEAKPEKPVPAPRPKPPPPSGPAPPSPTTGPKASSGSSQFKPPPPSGPAPPAAPKRGQSNLRKSVEISSAEMSDEDLLSKVATLEKRLNTIEQTQTENKELLKRILKTLEG